MQCHNKVLEDQFGKAAFRREVRMDKIKYSTGTTASRWRGRRGHLNLSTNATPLRGLASLLFPRSPPSQVVSRIAPTLRAFNPDLVLLSMGFDGSKVSRC
jgi:hypothetical protein